jgi:hypothetical protein
MYEQNQVSSALEQAAAHDESAPRASWSLVRPEVRAWTRVALDNRLKTPKYLKPEPVFGLSQAKGRCAPATRLEHKRLLHVTDCSDTHCTSVTSLLHCSRRLFECENSVFVNICSPRRIARHPPHHLGTYAPTNVTFELASGLARQLQQGELQLVRE